MRISSLFAMIISAVLLGASGCASRTTLAQEPGAVLANDAHPIGPEAENFYSDLSPYGRWFWLDQHGWAWTPYNVSYEWRPYTEGHWVYTDDGWTWDSDYPWGWACFHYGRWLYDDDYGWVWVPGTQWSPAWVAWNYGDLWCGWAPIPPGINWESHPDWDDVIPYSSWCFINRDDFLRRRLHGYILPEARNVTLLHHTKNITRYEFHDHRIINHSLPIEQFEKDIGHNIPRYKTVPYRSPIEARRFHAKGNQIAIVQPRFEERHGEHVHASALSGEIGRLPVQGPRIENIPLQPGQMNELFRRQQAERQRFYEYQNKHREALRQYHQHEWEHPPQGVPYHELYGRQMEEDRALNHQLNRENYLFEQQRAREFYGGMGRFHGPEGTEHIHGFGGEHGFGGGHRR